MNICVRNSLAALAGIICLSACAAAERESERRGAFLQIPPPFTGDVGIDTATNEPLGEYERKARWNVPRDPFQVYGDIYYVGTATIGAYLITTPKGHFLIDGGLKQSALAIVANIEKLGFDIADVRYLLNSHAHYDHAGSLAALKLLSGGTMVASAGDRPYLEAGDIGFGPSAGDKFPPVRVDRVVADGEDVTLGNVVLTANLTPGHSPGCTTWTMVAKVQGKPDRSVAFHCSATVAGQSLVPEDYPGIVRDFRQTFAKLKTMDADIFLAFHSQFIRLDEKRERQLAGDEDAFVAPGEFTRFNQDLEVAFEAELSRQRDAHGLTEPKAAK